ncbi:MAG: hypothetical protein DRI61_06270 [Chloroflexi bacterium]|nr:MAG: hypothetical protein DRI61_06270 [Chloroflexota bacterium]
MQIRCPYPLCPYTRSHGLMESATWEPEQDGSIYILWRCKKCGATVEMTVRPGGNASNSLILVPADEQ